MNLADKIKTYETVKSGMCPNCGNRFWFDKPQDWECTMCAEIQQKTIAETLEHAKRKKQ